MLEDEASRGRADEPAELPREAGERHVAAEQSRLRQVDDQRSVDGAVKTLPQREDPNRHAEDDRCLCAREPLSAAEHRDERSRPDHSHQRQSAHPAPALDELHDRELR